MNVLKFISVILYLFFLFIFQEATAQQNNVRDTSQFLTLKQCVDYALIHQPNLNRSLINTSIARVTNAINEAGWYPQIGITGSLSHYLELPVSFFSDSASSSTTPVKQRVGVVNTFTPELYITQAIFSPSLLYAVKSCSVVCKASTANY